MLQNFSVAISVSPHVCFILVLILILKPPSNFIAGRPNAAILFCLLLVVLLLARFIVVSVLSICLVCNFSIVATCPSIQLPALLFVCVLFFLFVDVLSGTPRQN